MGNLNLCFKLFLLLIAADVISAARNLRIHKSSPSSSPLLLFPKKIEGSRKGDTTEGIKSVKAYLQRYGYLSKRNNDNATTTTTEDTLSLFDDSLESAVKLYQQFFQLNVSGILDADTIRQMSRRRCGVPDHFIDENNNSSTSDSLYAFFPKKPRWPLEKTELTYAFINAFPTEYMGAVVEAMDGWETNSRFSFSSAARVQSADVKISFEKGDHGDGYIFEQETLAHAFAPTDGRLHFNSDQTWAVDPIYVEYDVESVALHEFGHILGLGHSAIRHAIMWPDMDYGVIKTDFDQDDIAGIRALYS